jgi:hypothetical protein
VERLRNQARRVEREPVVERVAVQRRVVAVEAPGAVQRRLPNHAD